MSAVIEVQDLTKYYGKHRGVEALDFSVGRGEVFGYLGPNGAGKTTTIRCLLGMLKATGGSMRVLGEPVTLDGSALRRRIGYVPGEVHLYERETGRWLMEYVSGFRGGKGPLEAELCERLEYDPSRRIKELSKGNKQKLALVLAMMHDPELLILDEPTSGLDPLNQEVVFDIVSERVADGATVFFSSHILSEVERVCDRVGIVREGSLVALEDVKAMLSSRTRSLRASFAEPLAADPLEGLAGVRSSMLVDGVVLHASVTSEAIDGAVKALAAHSLVDMELEKQDLEAVFLEYYRHDESAREGSLDAGAGDAS